MVVVKSYHLPPTPLIPNSTQPLLHYPGFLSNETDQNAVTAYDLLSGNGWQVQWIFRYGPTQRSHYHSAAHECMIVLTGEAQIRFGVADTTPDLEENTFGRGKEKGGVELKAQVGDVFIVPAGVAHKTYNTSPGEFKLLTPGDGHGIPETDKRSALAKIGLTGFTMIGAYPPDSVWDFAEGGEHHNNYEKVWSVSKPQYDPVLGDSSSGLIGIWR